MLSSSTSVTGLFAFSMDRSVRMLRPSANAISFCSEPEARCIRNVLIASPFVANFCIEPS
ncbi:hypothetical protein DMC47_38715 [Nostoc sp. 3335mG]|nr:hypothetical protein DMC47_38715 [Nostoc sp. 3335mG]